MLPANTERVSALEFCRFSAPISARARRVLRALDAVGILDGSFDTRGGIRESCNTIESFLYSRDRALGESC